MDRAVSVDELRVWVEGVAGGPAMAWRHIAGGNRCQSWAVDVRLPTGAIAPLYLRYQPPRAPSAEPYTVWREAAYYRALQGTDVPAPKLIATNPDCEAILTERVAGRADYRRIAREADRIAVAHDFVSALVRLHRLPLAELGVPDHAPGASIADCVRRELAIWRGMYEETGQADALIDLALAWLDRNVPAPAGPPVLVHGDAGPGNFLFDNGRMTALLDWELAHPGDPMEDLAWFSMRAVMEPVPDFPACLREYGRLAGAAPDHARIRYHRVFVSTRVTIIRHRNVTGLPGNSIVSRALNRRLLVAALAEATGVALPPPDRPAVPPTGRTGLYDHVIEELRREIADASSEPKVVAAAKDAAKVIKYLRDAERLGGWVEGGDLDALAALLGARPADVAAGQAALLQALAADVVGFPDVVRYFARSTAAQAELAAAASGGLAGRGFPPLENERTGDV